MVQADSREWRPKCGHTKAILTVIVLALFGALVFAFAVQAFSQDGSAQQPFDWRGLAAAMVPALWAGVAPIAMKYLTWLINLAGTYVPRYIQVPVAGLLGAVAASWTGDMTTVTSSIIAGGAAQTYAATPPEKLRTTAPPQPQPADGQPL